MQEVIDKIKADIEADAELAKAVDDVEIGMLDAMQYRLSDAIREGSKHSEQAYNWGRGDKMCALTAAYAAAKARDYC